MLYMCHIRVSKGPELLQRLLQRLLQQPQYSAYSAICAILLSVSLTLSITLILRQERYCFGVKYLFKQRRKSDLAIHFQAKHRARVSHVIDFCHLIVYTTAR